jgi:alkylation response protein AidB-like acyl-CoA dehydrogenase
MDLDPDDDQRALVDMVAAFAADRFDSERARRFADTFDRDAWAELAGLGTFGIALPESVGGVGLAAIDEVLVHEALGAALVPGPLIAAALAAGLIDGVLDGSVVPAVLDAPTHGPVVVEHLRDADVLLVVHDDGIDRIDPTTLQADLLELPTDPLTPVSRLGAVPIGDRVADAGTAAQWRHRGSLLASAQLCGNSAGSTALAVRYAAEREQFGRPVGSFQGLKHLLADCWIRTEVARSAVWAAGVTVDEPEVGDVARAIAGARLTSARAATENGKTGIQVHGGMGFTWEVDAHLFLKRAWVLETAFGSVDDAADTIAATLVG